MLSRMRLRRRATRLLHVVFFVTLSMGQNQEELWKTAASAHEWRFPDDHRAHHDYRLEWWYFTGHLKTASDSEPRFAYQFTFYRLGLTPDLPRLESDWAARSLIMGHTALIDLQSGKRFFSEVLYRAVPLLGGFGTKTDPLIAWSRAPAGSQGFWKLFLQEGTFRLEAVDDNQGLSLQLSAVPKKPLVLQAPDGLSFKDDAPETASRYFSFTRLATEGTLILGNKHFQVQGVSWMDHEFSSGALGEEQIGWDWFSLQLDDGREVMLFRVRTSSQGTDFAAGTLIDTQGRADYLPASRWSAIAERVWKSPSGRASYPVEWRIDILEWDLSLRVRAAFDDQENRSRLTPGLDYWEGSIRIFGARGHEVGRGFLEMTGYGNNLRPPI